MVIRRTDARRRRVVLEEATSQLENDALDPVEAAENGSSASRKPKPARNYLPGAHRRHQPKATDWIPKRPASVAIFMAVLLAVASAIVGAAWLMPTSLEPAFESGIRERFSVQGSRSLSIWFSTVLLLVSGLASLQIRALRQHRSNDYQGTYRIWLLFSGLLIFASINCVIDVGGLVQDYARQIQDGSVHWTAWALPAAQILALGVVFVRGMVEVRKSPASFAIISLVWLAYSVSIALRIPGIDSQVVQDDGFTAASLNLLATAGILAAVTVYARHVYLRANGLVATAMETAKPKRKPKPARKPAAIKAAESTGQAKPVAKKKSRKVAKSKPDSETDEREADKTVESPKHHPAPVTRDRFAKPGDFRESPDFTEDKVTDESADDELPIRKLTKSERKQMKKLQMGQQDRRAA